MVKRIMESHSQIHLNPTTGAAVGPRPSSFGTMAILSSTVTRMDQRNTGSDGFVKDGQVNSEDGGENGYYPPETIQALNELNKTYAGVVLGGDFRVAKEGFDDHNKKHTLSFLKITALYNLLANMKARVSVGHDNGYEAKKLAVLWMEWDGRRTYEDIVFDPSCKCGPKVYNLFRGFPVEPKAGDWSLMRRHIKEIICDGNEGITPTSCHGWQGLFKIQGEQGQALWCSRAVRASERVFSPIISARYSEKHSSQYQMRRVLPADSTCTGKSLFVFLDEAVWGGDKKTEGKMKQLLTERRVLFEPKGIDTMALDNHINVLIASNEDWVIPATGDERRFFVLNPNEKYKCDIPYFTAIGREKDNGGVAAMMHDLLAWDYRVCELRKAPKTEGLSSRCKSRCLRCLTSGSRSCAVGTCYQTPKQVRRQIEEKRNGRVLAV